MDTGLLVTVLILLGLGLVMIYSASSVEAMAMFHRPYYYLERQMIWAGLGVTGLIVAARIDYWRWTRLAWPLGAVTLFLLIAVLVPHVGININGARRWLGFGPLSFQPSELSKFTVVLLFAATLTRRQWPVERFYPTVVAHLIALGVVFALILKEPDLGTALALGMTVFVMLWVAGARTAHLLGLALMAIPLVLVVIITEPYRLQRLLAFLHPWKNPLGSGYHIIQSLYALGSGGLFGSGIGRSALKFFYLPEQHTDFIFAILGEEIGLVGTTAVIVLFFIFAWRGLRISLLAPDRFGVVLGVGLTTMVVAQAFMNIGVVTASIPITGIPLPFLSYGGSSLVFALTAIGILLNLSRQGARTGP